MTFAGQGGDALAELATLVAQRPALREGLAVAAAVLAEAAASPARQAGGASATASTSSPGPRIPTARRPPRYLRSAAVSYPLILPRRRCCGAPSGRTACAAMRGGALVAAAGHSQGLLAALLVSESGAGGVDDALLARYVRLAWTVGAHAALRRHAGRRAAARGVSGVRLPRLAELLDEVNAEAGAATRRPSRWSTRRRGSSSAGRRGRSRSLRARLAGRRGARGGPAPARPARRAPLRFGWSPLEVDVAYHTPALREPWRCCARTSPRSPALLPDPAALALPVLARRRPRPARTARPRVRGRPSQLVAPVRWDIVARALSGAGADWVLDLGPGTDVAPLTAENLRGTARACSRSPRPRAAAC